MSNYNFGRVGQFISMGVSTNSSAPSAAPFVGIKPPEIGELRTMADGKIMVWTGSQWNDVSPNQHVSQAPTPTYTLDLDATPVDALALAIYRTYETEPGANLPAARAAAGDVIRTLDELGFEVLQGRGSVTGRESEDDFDFSDICNTCAVATDEYADYMRVREDGTAPPDRFCLFHRGWVMGKLA